MAQIAGDASDFLQDPPLTLDDLKNNSRFLVEDEPDGRVNVTDLDSGIVFNFNPKTPSIYKVSNDNKTQIGNVYKDIAGVLLDLKLQGRSLPIPVVTAKSIEELVDVPSAFTYKDGVSPQKYKNSYLGVQGADPNQKKEIQEPNTTPSLFNKWSLMKYRGTPFNDLSNTESNVERDYRKINLEQDLVGIKSPSTFYLITKLKELDLYSHQYDFSDFALAKFNNKISNNRLITLRRFAGPVEDDIITQERVGKTEDNKKETYAINIPPIAQAITWFDESTGNNLNEILNFNYGLNFKQIESGIQTIQRTGEGGGFLNSLAQKFPLGVRSFLTGRNVVSQRQIEAEGNDFDPLTTTYPNYVLGPYNVIKKMEVRDSGLEFTHEFKLTFEYKIRYFPGVNPKVLFLDQFANILALTYNTAPFWGGSVRHVGGNNQVIPPLGNLKSLADGDIGGFLKSVISDASSFFNSRFESGSFQSAFDALKANASESLSAIKDGKIPNLGPLVTNLLGGKLMDLVNTPQGGQTVQAFLTGEATGQWHMTVGNPLNPIAMIGNLVCTGTNITFGGAMGLQDFPEDIKVEISLKPGRPRDKADIESMFNCGRGRLYLEPNDTFTNGLDINGEANAPEKQQQQKDKMRKILKQMSNG